MDFATDASQPPSKSVTIGAPIVTWPCSNSMKISHRLVIRHNRANRHRGKVGTGVQDDKLIFKPDSRWKCRPVCPLPLKEISIPVKV